MKKNILFFQCCIGLLLGHAFTAGILNTGSISAAGGFIGAGLFAVAISFCRDSATVPQATAEPAADDTNTVGATEPSAVTGNRQ
jgi:hypothetical protein